MHYSSSKPIDRFFLLSVLTLTIFGFVIFLSASLGLLAKDGANFNAVAIKQGVSLLIGVVSFFLFSRIRYPILKKLAFFILLGAIGINLLLFIPGMALHFGGATRWITIGGFFSIQPSEFLKIAFIIYMSAWIQYAKDKISTMKYGLIPYLFIMITLGALLLSQRDTDTLFIIGITGLIMLMIAGLKIKHITIIGFLMIIMLGAVLWFRPYALTRVKTFIDRGSDTQGAGYQINQSLIAIGSGQITGRGFGQSIQKFGYLPQPTDDSIFAVAAEEFGFIGSVGLIILYLLLATSAFRVGLKAPDMFGGFLAIGIAILIVIESFLNMGAMMGLVPLSGLPLLFVSHGGTAMIMALTSAGIVANVSKYTRN